MSAPIQHSGPVAPTMLFEGAAELFGMLRLTCEIGERQALGLDRAGLDYSTKRAVAYLRQIVGVTADLNEAAFRARNERERRRRDSERRGEAA